MIKSVQSDLREWRSLQKSRVGLRRRRDDDFNGRACCWIHFQVLSTNSRPLEFQESTPLRMVGAL